MAETPSDDPLSPDPLIREPKKIPGKTAPRLSPNEYAELTHVTRPPVPIREDWHLKEEEIEAVNKDGIERFGMKFKARELVKLTTGNLSAVKRLDLRIRYDEGRLSRGVLDEMKLYHEDQDGYHLICILQEESVFRARTDPSDETRERTIYEQQLRERVELNRGFFRHLTAPGPDAEDYDQNRAATNRLGKGEQADNESSLDKARAQEQQKAHEHWEGLPDVPTEAGPDTRAAEEESARPTPADMWGGESEFVDESNDDTEEG